MARSWDKVLRTRIDRRRLLQRAGGTALGAAGLVVVGCNDGGSGSSSTNTPGADAPSGTPKPGGIYKQRQTTAYSNFNPFGPGISALAAGLFTGYAIFDHLWFVPTDTGEIEPFLMTDHEVIDPQTIRVTFGESVFHDIPPVNGRPDRSTDLKASIERFAEQVPFGFSWLQEVMERVETPDDRTIVYYQNRPWAWFWTSSNAGSPWTSSIIPEEIVDDDDQLNTQPIGSGRWFLEGHEGGTNVRLRKHPNWREPGLPYMDGVDNVYATDDTLAQSAFAAQDIDRLTSLTRLEVDDLVNQFGDDIFTDSDLSRSYRTIMLKNEPPFDDPEVRHAISLGLNRDELRQVLNLGEGEFCGPLPPAHTAYVLPPDDPDLQEYFRYDPEDARARLEATGFPMDQEFELKYSNFQDAPDLAEVVGRQLNELGLNVRLPGPEDITAWLSNTLGVGNFQMTAFNHLAYEDPSLPLSFYRSPNQMGYENPEVEAAFDAAAEALDEDERIEATREAQRVIIRDWAPMINLYSPVTFAATWGYVKDIVTGRGSYGTFNTKVWLDK
jgi:ABC-type transport system substrate-binding protein